MDALSLVDMFHCQLQLCKLKKGEVMAVLTGPRSRPEYAQAFVAAGQRLGAEVFRLDLVAPGPTTDASVQGVAWGRTPLSGHQSGLKALCQADILIDLMILLHSPEQVAIQRSGTRVLLVAEPPDVLARMFPRESLRPRVEFGGDLLSRARHLRVTSPAGTDVHYDLGQYEPILQYGYTDAPGRWDHMPGGFTYTWPNEAQSEGTIVLSPGDIIYPFNDFLRTEIKFTVKRGMITAIEGGLDAALVSDFLAQWRDPDAYAMAHIGWGLDETAIWNNLAFANKETTMGMDGRALYGGVLWSTGPNTDVGGTRNTPAHLDIVMKGANLYLDDEPVVLAGDVVPEQMRPNR